jgi:hypothetical protein
MSEMSVGVSSSYLQQVLYIFFWGVIYLAKPQLILHKSAHNQLKFQQAHMTISASSFSGMWLHFHLVFLECSTNLVTPGSSLQLIICQG